MKWRYLLVCYFLNDFVSLKIMSFLRRRRELYLWFVIFFISNDIKIITRVSRLILKSTASERTHTVTRTLFELFFFCKQREEKTRDYKGEFFLLLNLTEKRKKEVVGMLPSTRFEAAHSAVWCANEFAYLVIFKADQLRKELSR